MKKKLISTFLIWCLFFISTVIFFSCDNSQTNKFEDKPYNDIESQNLTLDNTNDSLSINNSENNCLGTLDLPSFDQGIEQLKSNSIPFVPDQEEDTWQVLRAMTGDIVRYYKYDEMFSSELKRQIFMESAEGVKEKLEFDQIKKDILNSLWLVDFNNSKYSRNLVSGGSWQPSRYDIENEGFIILMRESCVEIQDVKPKTMAKIITFNSLPTVVIENELLGPDFREYFFLKMDKATGLKCEENIKDLNFLIVFRINNFFSFKGIYGDLFGESKGLISCAAQVILYNQINGEIYFRKNFTEKF